ncbi:MAG TPA: glycerol-3-phosphate 1-O-acyltransferase PlsY [Planctomycetota bacterium]|nr:glycerol-3-phosphate 1-O-acyltransferase PlsY [Planctomycetota bacterium]
MPNELAYVLTGLFSYFVGAIPSGYILVKLKTGKDVRTLGSGNIGATNVARALGTPWFIPVFLFDFLKGFAPVFWLAPWVAARWKCGSCAAPTVSLAVLCALLSMLGHMWPIYLGFRGGKGVATVGGILFAMNWIAALIAIAVWGVVFLLSRYVSLGSMVAALALPVAHQITAPLVMSRWAGETPWVMTVFLGVAAVLVIFRHRSNLKRLLDGTEQRFGKKPA